MGESYKGFDRGEAVLATVESSEIIGFGDFQPLFDDQLFDPKTQGGLATCTITHADGSTTTGIGQLYSPVWVHNGRYDPADRFSILPLHFVTDADGQTIIERDRRKFAWDPARPDIGSESERHAENKTGPVRLTINGEFITLPDGSTQPFVQAGRIALSPEGLRYTIEFGTNVALGFTDYVRTIVRANYDFEQWLEVNNLTSPCLGVLPNVITTTDFTQLSYILKISGRIRSLVEFAVQGEQVHAPLRSHPDAAHALAMLQGVQWISELGSASSPIRDGSFDTTVLDHYNDNHLANDGKPVLYEDDYLRYLFGADSTARRNVPYDWRYFARVLGSNNGGAHSQILPSDFQAYLRAADLELRSETAPISIDRFLGPHTDRYRLSINTGEISNAAPSGGNLLKKLAFDEIIVKYFIAEQIWHARIAKEQPAGWEQMVAERQVRAIEIGHINNFFVGVSGKGTNYLSTDMPTRSGGELPQVADRTEILAKVIAFTDEQLAKYGVSISEAAKRETHATMSDPIDIKNFDTPEQVMRYFFEPESTLTASEALRYVRELDKSMTVTELLGLYSRVRRENLYALCAFIGIDAYETTYD